MKKLVKLLSVIVVVLTVALILVYKGKGEGDQEITGNWLLVSESIMPQKIVITPKEIIESETAGIQSSQALHWRHPQPYSKANQTLFIFDKITDTNYQYTFKVEGDNLFLSTGTVKGQYLRTTTE